MSRRGGESPGHGGGTDRVVDRGTLERLRQLLARPGEISSAELVELFVTDSLAGVDRLRGALEHGDADGASHQLHLLKGDAGVFGARLLYDLCDALARKAGSGRFAAVAEELPALEDALEAVGEVLREELSGPQPGS